MTRRKYEFNVLKTKAVNQWIAESVTKQKSSFHFTGVSLPLFFFIWIFKLPRKCLLRANKRPIFLVRFQRRPSPFLSADQKANKNPCMLFPGYDFMVPIISN